MPTLIASASLHPDKQIFVAGGEDFKMYKFDYITGNEIGEILVSNLLATLKKKPLKVVVPIEIKLYLCLQNLSKVILGQFMQ